MPNAQEWLDSNYPKSGACRLKTTKKRINNFSTKSVDNLNYGKTRSEIIELTIECEDLIGELNLEGFSNLTELNCGNNQLTNLDLNSCPNLTELNCGNNQLTNLDFLQTIYHPKKLVILNVTNNKITSDLISFSNFTNLLSLRIGNDNSERINEGIYNRFTGSLEPLKNLIRLNTVCIEGTDIDGGLEYLPDSLNEAQYDSYTEAPNSNGSRVYCSPKKRPGSKVAAIKEQLKPFGYNLGKWKENYRKQAFLEQEKELNETKTKLTELENNWKLAQNNYENVLKRFRELSSERKKIKSELEEIERNKKTQSDSSQATILALQTQLTAKEEELSKVLRESTSSTVSLRAEISQLKEDLAKAQTDNTKQAELEKNLLTLTVSSSLLLKQVEDLTINLTEAEQEQERLKLAKENKEKDFQNLLRTSEINLKQAQAIITAKNEALTKLEQEKNDLTSQLVNAQAIITDLENNTIASLETKLKDLENTLLDDDNKQAEITNLKQQLSSEKTRFNTQLTKLQQELTSASQKEQTLSAKIAELSRKKTKFQENDITNNSSSWWDKVSTPLFYAGGIGIIVLAFVWVKSKVKRN